MLTIKRTALALWSVWICSCGTYFNQPIGPQEARIGEFSPKTGDLHDLLAPEEPVVVGVYNFKDQTGQYKNVENGSTFSTAVPQGGTTMLIKALEDSGWFTPIERENLSNLLNERNIIRSTREEYNRSSANGQPNLPPLLYAGVLLEGGIISYDSNIITGGYGARYFGAGGSAQYRQDRITIYLRAVSTSTGKILKTVYVSKTILSQALDASLFRFVKFQRLLEAETGITKNEPIQLAVQNAIESAVEALIIEGIEDGLWKTAKGERADKALVDLYNEQKMLDESTLLYDRYQQKEIWNNAFGASITGPVLNGDFSKKSLGLGGMLYYKKYITPFLDLGLSGNYLYFTGGANFYKEYMSGNLTAGFTLLPYDRITPYIYAGVGGIFDLRSPGPELEGETSGINLQYGLALKYNFNPKWSLVISAENNHTVVDGLDNLINGVRDDYFYNFGLGIEYRFGKEFKKKTKYNGKY